MGYENQDKKSCLMTIKLGDDQTNQFARLFQRDFPFKYIGVHLHYSKLRRQDIQPNIGKIIKEAGGWTGRLLSYGEKLTLLKS